MAQNVRVDWEPPFCTITFDDPDTLNSFTNAGHDQFADALEEADRREDIYIVVWQATGRFFNAGANVGKRSPGETYRETRSVRRKELARITTITDVARLLFNHTKLLVAVMNGPALGIGAGFLGLFDLVYSTPGTWIAVPFHSIGIAAEVNSTTSFVDKLGLGKANEVLYWGKKMHVDELVQTGFVNKIFPPSESLLTQSAYPPSPSATALDLHAQVRSHLVQNLEGLDLSSILLTKKLVKAGIHERNNPDAVSAREAAANVGQAVKGVPGKRFEELARGGRRHKL